ncbi:hypothetical protein Clacol_001760 [Clathrus columnatus]|uniref:Gfd2/YDR514C-like C-terminal domain-containing protein n=1 Tax=Clathrus columnatus TaxID=1419009 RepID=A0AAV5A4H9_9AGAM|nr:hypothetical protein Clacol_001760 [Clathrus columnatus]
MVQIVVHGYYRYTDINFEWTKALENPSDRSALKGFISTDALVHPDHPLNVTDNLKEPEPGITFTIGTFESGESRLLYTSKQVEYIRYWLHATGYTEELIPLPGVDYLLTESSLKTTYPVTYKTGADIKNAIKDIQKNNKRLKGTDKTLLAYRDMFAQSRKYWQERNGTWLAIDIESWEMDHTVITEYGWCQVNWEGEQKRVEDGHFIIDEYKTYHNGQYVTDNREHYLFGESKMIKLKDLKQFIRDQITNALIKGPLYLVFHDHNQDIKQVFIFRYSDKQTNKSNTLPRYLNRLGAPIDDLEASLPNTSPSQGLYLVDTSSLFGALEGRTGETRGLERMCILLKVPDTQRFHNAGNDAHFTMLALESMASGEMLDQQRAARWPGQETTINPSGGKSDVVDWKPHQIDSDYDDMEGIFPPQKHDQMRKDPYASDESDAWVN